MFPTFDQRLALPPPPPTFSPLMMMNHEDAKNNLVQRSVPKANLQQLQQQQQQRHHRQSSSSSSTALGGAGVGGGGGGGVAKDGSSGGTVPTSKLPFPYKLYTLLDDADRGVHSDIVSWLPDGSGFKIHDAKAFSETVMSTYFNQSKYKSFTRQLYLYGFLKLASGQNEGAFYHPNFVRSDRDACLAIRRNQFEGDRRHAKKGIAKSAATTTSSSLRKSTGNSKNKNKRPNDDCSSSSSSCCRSSKDRGTHRNILDVPSSDSLLRKTGGSNKAALTLFDQMFNLIDNNDSDPHNLGEASQPFSNMPSHYDGSSFQSLLLDTMPPSSSSSFSIAASSGFPNATFHSVSTSVMEPVSHQIHHQHHHLPLEQNGYPSHHVVVPTFNGAHPGSATTSLDYDNYWFPKMDRSTMATGTDHHDNATTSSNHMNPYPRTTRISTSSSSSNSNNIILHEDDQDDVLLDDFMPRSIEEMLQPLPAAAAAELVPTRPSSSSTSPSHRQPPRVVARDHSAEYRL